MKRLLTNITILSMAFILFSLSGEVAVEAQEIKDGGLTGEVLSLTATVFPQGDTILLSVPSNQNFILTQACFVSGGTNFRIQNVGGGGLNSQVTLDNTVCQDYTPGVVFYGGDDVSFRNNSSGAPVRLLLNGILTK